MHSFGTNSFQHWWIVKVFLLQILTNTNHLVRQRNQQEAWSSHTWMVDIQWSLEATYFFMCGGGAFWGKIFLHADAVGPQELSAVNDQPGIIENHLFHLTVEYCAWLKSLESVTSAIINYHHLGKWQRRKTMTITMRTPAKFISLFVLLFRFALTWAYFIPWKQCCKDVHPFFIVCFKPNFSSFVHSWTYVVSITLHMYVTPEIWLMQAKKKYMVSSRRP